MIRYTITQTGEILYNTNMLKETLKVSKSFLIREMKKYNFSENDYIRYKNQILFKEKSVMDFMDYLIKNRMINHVEELNRMVEKIKVNTDELQKNSISE